MAGGEGPGDSPSGILQWLNHRKAIAAMDFFAVPIFVFGVLYCFLVIRHGSNRR